MDCVDLEIGDTWNGHTICKVGDGFIAAFGGIDPWLSLGPFLVDKFARKNPEMIWCPLNRMHA